MTNLLATNLKRSSLAFSESSLAVTCVFLLFVADGSVVVLSAFNADFYRVSLVLRTLLELYIIFFFLNNGAGTLGRKSLVVVLTLFTIVCAGSAFFVISGNELNPVETFVAFNKYIFIFVAYPFVMTVFTKSRLTFQRLCRVYELIIYLNSAAVLAGLIFNIGLFRSYIMTESDNRFGYKGLIYAQNEASLFYMIALFYAIYLYHTKGNKALLLLTIFCNYVLGTKAGLIFPTLICLSYLLVIRKSLMLKVAALTSVCCVILCLFIFDIDAILFQFPVYRYFHYFYTRSGIWTMLFSNRDVFIQDRFWPIVDNWTWVNWLCGGTNIDTNAIEMDFHDTFLLMGIVGSVIYVWNYLRLFFIKGNVRFAVVFGFYYFLVAGLGGHVFYSSMNVVYLCILLLKLREMTLFDNRESIEAGI